MDSKFLKYFLFILIILSHHCSNKDELHAQERPIIFSHIYNLSSNLKIINDSILLDGYLAFEFNPQDDEAGYDKTKKYFSFNVYFIFDIEDLLNENSLKIYYNSNKILYGFYSNEDNEFDSTSISEKNEFVKVYRKYQKRYKVFRIENLHLNLLTEDSDNIFFQLDSLSGKGFYLFRISIEAFTFVDQIDIKFSNSNDAANKLNLLFFEPISEALIFEPEDALNKYPEKFQKSLILEEYLKLNK